VGGGMMAEPWTPERMRALAERTSESGLHNRNEAIGWRKWTLASSLSVNGGAAIAIMNLSATEIDEASRRWAVVWFICGVVASLIYGFVSAAIMARWGGYFHQSSWVMQKRAMGEEAEKLDIEQFGKLEKADGAIQWIQYLALPLFLIGLGVVIEGLK
jgi:hypothetical protein